jgi:hypothetical protein
VIVTAVMSDREILYQLLFDALLELRVEGAEANNPTLSRLADLFHQIPNRLRAIDAGETDAQSVLAELRKRRRRASNVGWRSTCRRRAGEWHRARLQSDSSTDAAYSTYSGIGGSGSEAGPA